MPMHYLPDEPVKPEYPYAHNNWLADTSPPSDEQEREALIAVMDLARDAIKSETQKCVFCRNSIFFYAWHKALTRGHCYSQEGVKDIRIVGACEYCMDELADAEDDGE